MESNYIDHQLNLKVQKRIKDLKGFYTHLISTFLILPFIIYINLKTVPQFHWFWFAIAAWFLGLFIHFLNVFFLSESNAKENWSQKKLNNIIENNTQKTNYINEQYYLKAKKNAKEMKGFYIHFFITIISLVIVIVINLKFVPGFHFFWFVLVGMFLAVFLHWLGVFGFNYLGLGKKWEERKIKELVEFYKL